MKVTAESHAGCNHAFSSTEINLIGTRMKLQGECTQKLEEIEAAHDDEPAV